MKISRRKTRRHLAVRRGTAAVEFAFAAITMFFIIFSCIEFARLSLMRNLAQDAAYVAARHCMVDGATEQEAIDKANEVLSWVGTREAVVTINDGDFSGDDETTIQVDISIPMEKNSFIVSRFTHAKSMEATIALAAERYTGFFDPTLLDD